MARLQMETTWAVLGQRRRYPTDLYPALNQALSCVTFILMATIGCGASPLRNPMTKPEDAYVVRTSFGDDAAWHRVTAAVRAPRIIGDTECFAYVELIDDPKNSGLDPLAVVHSLPDDYPQYFVFVVDDCTLSDDETPVLVINFLPDFSDSYDTKPCDRTLADIQTLRAIPSTIQSIENNLSIANMGFEEYAESADADGVFRGFPPPTPNRG